MRCSVTRCRRPAQLMEADKPYCVQHWREVSPISKRNT